MTIIDLKFIFTERTAESIVSDGMTCENILRLSKLAPIRWSRKRRLLLLCGCCQPGRLPKQERLTNILVLWMLRGEKNGAARPSQDSVALFWRFSERTLDYS